MTKLEALAQLAVTAPKIAVSFIVIGVLKLYVRFARALLDHARKRAAGSR